MIFIEYTDERHMETTLLSYNDDITPEYIGEVIQYVNTLDEKPALIRKICFLIVETLQNVIHHSDKNENGNTFAYFELIKDDTYIIKTGNLITKEHTDDLDKKIKDVLVLTKSEVKEKITDTLANESFSEKGGAGIGLLSIKKRVNDGMLYEIEIFDGDYNMIHFEIKI